MDYQSICEKIAEKKVEYFKAVGSPPNTVMVPEEVNEILVTQYVNDFGVNPELPLKVMGLDVESGGNHILVYINRRI
jgi:hypothetical protein